MERTEGQANHWENGRRERGLASYCDFGTALETNLRDRFVLGLGPGPERDKLFEQNPSTLTLTRAIELAEQAACAKQAMGMMCNSEAIPFKEEPVYRVRDQRQPGRVSGARRADGGYSASSRCAVCGMQNHQNLQPTLCPNVENSVDSGSGEELVHSEGRRV
ncbi:unnamed protein product, partial [Iphiclides podalirius]